MPETAKCAAAPKELLGLAAQALASYSILLNPKFTFARHTKVLVSALEAIERGEIDRLLISMPPQHGKSEQASIRFPCWYLGRHPDRSVVGASYSQELADEFGRKVRNGIIDPRHQAVFPDCRMSEDSSAASRFNLLCGGSYFSVGRGGGLTGRGADLIVIDDPLKDLQEASSPAIRAELKDWFRGVAYTRLRPGGALVAVATRWHTDDLAGWLLREHSSEGWHVINLPAIAEKDGADWRSEGEALWPERFPLSMLERSREQLGPQLWSAEYQGRPVPEGGAIFKSEWFRSYREAPNIHRVIQGWDSAFKTGTGNDFSACVTLGESRPDGSGATPGFYVLDVWRDRLEFPDLKKRIAAAAEAWKPSAVLIEDKASGQSLVQELKRETLLPILPVEAKGSKELRAQLVTPLIESGRVFLPEAAPWRASFLDELVTFPSSAHEDMVDAFVHALGWLRGKSRGEWKFVTVDETHGQFEREWKTSGF
jgi:predicted phage terminase large subunit-like protein